MSLCRQISLTFLAAAAIAVCFLPGNAATAEKAMPPAAPRFPFTEELAKTYQDEFAKAAGLHKEITNSVGMRLVLIPPGSYEMGPNGSK
jgi:formylglycine-generating enzyme required for sulfatase activity